VAINRYSIVEEFNNAHGIEISQAVKHDNRRERRIRTVYFKYMI
jgi:hypothetical protein